VNPESIVAWFVVVTCAPYAIFRITATVRAYVSRYEGQHRAAPGAQPMKSWCPTRPMRVIR
jgi:hypothetical protein